MGVRDENRKKRISSHDSIATLAPSKLYCKHNDPHYNGNNSMYLSRFDNDFTIYCITYGMIHKIFLEI